MGVINIGGMMKTVLAVLALIFLAFAYGVWWLEHGPTCERIQLGYNCKGNKCECKKVA